jgi:small GTP-binding protein
LTDAVENIKAQLQVCRREFLELFGSVMTESNVDAETFDMFQPTLEKIHKELRPKISLVGFSGVGKTTITHLIRAEEIPMEHVPTITGEIGTIKIGKLSFALWDFAGQEQFSFLWNKFVKGSDAVLLITDSTLENVEKSRFFTELVKTEAPHALVAVIGNKQDLPGAMPSPDIERMLGGAHTYSMVATDPSNRDKMITIIADILEMSAEVSPLLAPLINRDKKMTAAEDSLMSGDFQSACNYFNEIADLCLELGDDSLSQEFHEKAEKVKTTLAVSSRDSGVPTIAYSNEGKTPFQDINATSSNGEAFGESTDEMPSVVAPPPKLTSLIKTAFKPAPKLAPKLVPPAPAPKLIAPSPLIKPPSFAKPGPPPKAAGPVIKPPAFAQPKKTQTSAERAPYVTNVESIPAESSGQKPQVQATIMDLKIKIANINKFLLDIEMKSLMGEVGGDEAQQKKDRAEQMKKMLEQQLAENQQILEAL